MIICFEGPSAVGKTQLSRLLSEDFKIIPEVNQLFAGVDNTEEFWYYKKQVERYQMGIQTQNISILDGDVFQPLWYNWIYGYPAEFYSQEETHAFFLREIQQNRICFPDLYIVFGTTLEELERRKRHDETRSRRNFEKHLRLIQPQRTYFNFLKEETDVQVEFLEYDNIESTKKKVLNVIASYQKKEVNCLKTYDDITTWLGRKNKNR